MSKLSQIVKCATMNLGGMLYKCGQIDFINIL